MANTPVLHVIYAGHGDAMALEYSSKADENEPEVRWFMVVDGGPQTALLKSDKTRDKKDDKNDDTQDEKKSQYAPYTKFFIWSLYDIWQKIHGPTVFSPDFILNTHPHEDHYEGLVDLLLSSLPNEFQKDKTGPMYFNSSFLLPYQQKPAGGSALDRIWGVKTASQKTWDKTEGVFTRLFNLKNFKRVRATDDSYISGLDVAYPSMSDISVAGRSAKTKLLTKKKGISLDDLPKSLDAAAKGTTATVSDLVRRVALSVTVDTDVVNLSSILMTTTYKGRVVCTGDNVGWRIHEELISKDEAPRPHYEVYKIQHHGSIRNSQLARQTTGDIFSDMTDEHLAREESLRELMEWQWGTNLDNKSWHTDSKAMPVFRKTYDSPEDRLAMKEAGVHMVRAFYDAWKTEDKVTTWPSPRDCLQYLNTLRRRHQAYLFNCGRAGGKAPVGHLSLRLRPEPSAVWDVLWNRVLQASKDKFAAWTDEEKKQTVTEDEPWFKSRKLRKVDTFFAYNHSPDKTNKKDGTWIATPFWDPWCWADESSASYWLSLYTNIQAVDRLIHFYNTFTADAYVISANGTHGHPSAALVVALALLASKGKRHRELFLTSGYAFPAMQVEAIAYYWLRGAGHTGEQARARLRELFGANALHVRFLIRGVYMSIDGSATCTRHSRETAGNTTLWRLPEDVTLLQSLHNALENDRSVLPRQAAWLARYEIVLVKPNKDDLDWWLDMDCDLPELKRKAAAFYIEEEWQKRKPGDRQEEDKVGLRIGTTQGQGGQFWVVGDPVNGFRFLRLADDGAGEPDFLWLCGDVQVPSRVLKFLSVEEINQDRYRWARLKFVFRRVPFGDLDDSDDSDDSDDRDDSFDSCIAFKDQGDEQEEDQPDEEDQKEQEEELELAALRITSTFPAANMRSAAVHGQPEGKTTATSRAPSRRAQPPTTSKPDFKPGHKGTGTPPIPYLGGHNADDEVTYVEGLDAFLDAASLPPRDPSSQLWSARMALLILIGDANLAALGFESHYRAAALQWPIHADNVIVSYVPALFDALVRSASIPLMPPANAEVMVNGALRKVAQGVLAITWPETGQLKANLTLSLDGLDVPLEQSWSCHALPHLRRCRLARVLGNLLQYQRPATTPDFTTLALPALLGFLTIRPPSIMLNYLAARLPAALLAHGFLEQVVDLERSTVKALVAPSGRLMVKDAELMCSISQISDKVNQLLDGSELRLKFGDVRILLHHGGSPAEHIRFVGDVQASGLLLSFSMVLSTSIPNNTQPPITWTFRAGKDASLSSIASLWPNNKQPPLSDISLVPFSSSPLKDLKQDGAGFSIAQQVPYTPMYKVASIFCAVQIPGWEKYLPIPVHDANRAVARLEIRSRQDAAFRTVAVSIDFQVAIQNASAPCMVDAVLMAEPLPDNTTYDYRLSLAVSEPNVSIGKVAHAVGLGAQVSTLSHAIPMLQGMVDKLPLRRLSVALREGKEGKPLEQRALSMTVTLQDMAICEKIRLVEAEVDLRYNDNWWDSKAEGVLEIGNRRVSATTDLPQRDITGSVLITDPNGLSIPDMMQSCGITIPADVPLPEVVDGIANAELQSAFLGLMSLEDKSVAVGDWSFEMSLPGLRLGTIQLTKAVVCVASKNLVKQPEGLAEKQSLGVGIEAVVRDRFAVDVTYSSEQKCLTATFRATTPETVSSMIDFLLPKGTSDAAALVDLVGSFGVSSASVSLDSESHTPISFSLSVDKGVGLQVDTVTLRNLRVDHLKGCILSGQQLVSPKEEAKTRSVLRVIGTSTGSGAGANFSMMCKWGDESAPESIAVAIEHGSDVPLTMKRLLSILSWDAKVQKPSLPPEAIPPTTDYFDMFVLRATGRALIEAGSGSPGTVLLESLVIVVESDDKCELPGLPLTLEKLSVKVDYQLKRQPQPFQTSIWGYVQIYQAATLGLRYSHTDKVRYRGRLGTVGETRPDRIPDFAGMADLFLGQGTYSMPPNVITPDALALTALEVDYIPGEKLEVSGGSSQTWNIDTFGGLAMTLGNLGGQLVKKLGAYGTIEASLHGELKFSRFASSKAVLHLAKDNATSAMLVAPELARHGPLADEHGVGINDVAELMTLVNAGSGAWTDSAPRGAISKLAFSANIGLVVDFARQGLLLAGSIADVGSALLWVRKRLEQGMPAFDYQLFLKLDSVAALLPDVGKEIAEAFSLADDSIVAQISSSECGAADVHAQVSASVSVLTTTTTIAAAAMVPAAFLSEPRDKIPRGARLLASITLGEQGDLSRLLHQTLDIQPPASIVLDALVLPGNSEGPRYSVTTASLSMFNGILVLNKASGSYLAARKRLELEGQIVLHLEPGNSTHFDSVYYWADHDLQQTGFDFLASQQPTPAPPTVGFGSMLGVSLCVTRLRGTITPGTGAAARSSDYYIEGYATLFNGTSPGRLVFIDGSPKALVLDTVTALSVKDVFVDLIHKHGASDAVSWPNAFGDVILHNARLYYLRGTNKETVPLEGDRSPIVLEPGFHIHATMDLFDGEFSALAKITPSGLSIAASQRGPIDFGFYGFIETKTTDGPRISVSAYRHANGDTAQHFTLEAGLRLLDSPDFSLKLDYSGGVFSGVARYEGNSLSVAGAEITASALTVEHRDKHLHIRGLSIAKDIDVDIVQALHDAAKIRRQPAYDGEPISTPFGRDIKTRFHWTVDIKGLDHAAPRVEFTGFFTLSGFTDSSDPDLTFPLPALLEVDLRLEKPGFIDLVHCLEQSMLRRLEAIGEIILSRPDDAARIIAFSAPK